MLVCLVSGSVLADSNLLSTPPGAPSYTLSNARKETSRFGKSILAFDYRRNRKGFDRRVSISGSSGEGSVSIAASIPSSKDSGTIRLSSFFGSGDGINNVEIFLTQSYRTADGTTRSYLVSNSLRVGNPGTSTSGAAWTQQQRDALAEFQRIMNDDNAHKFPKAYKVTVQADDGYEPLPNNAIVTKGLELKACYSNKWHPVRTLSQNDDGTVNVLWHTFGSEYAYAMDRKELTINSKELAGLRRDPSIAHVPFSLDSSLPAPGQAMASSGSGASKDPSGLRLKSYKVTIDPLPGWSFVDAALDVPKDTPLKACYAGSWNPVTALACNDDGTIAVRWDKYGPSFDCRMVRKELIIRDGALDGSGAVVDKGSPSAKLTQALRHKNYNVTIAVPAHSQKIPKDVILAAGTPLQACYASKWNPITLLSCNTDGTLNVRWDAYGSGFDCSMSRDQLIIRKSLLSKTTKGSASSSGQPELRTWVDITGQFKIKAKLVEIKGTMVTLQTENGEKKTLPIAKLSQADQTFLSKPSSDNNPFK